MKTFRKIGLAVGAVMTAVSLTACGDDDDDDNPDDPNASGSTIKATLGGSDLYLTNGFWFIDDESTASPGNHTMVIEFYNYDLVDIWQSHDFSKVPSSFNSIQIGYEVPKSQTSIKSVTLESSEYELYVVSNATATSEGWQGETWFNATDNSPLVITRDGDSYTVRIDRAYVGQETPDSKKTVTLNFSGKLTRMPDEMLDEI